MRGVTQRWPARLISAVIALALIWASGIGAYAHAVGHCHHGHAHAAHQEIAKASPLTKTADAQQGESHKAPGAVDHTQCGDTICHGGYAIVGTSPVAPELARSTPAIAFVRAGAGLQPRSLERPPRSPVLV